MIDDLIQKLREAGIPTDGKWHQTPGKQAQVPMLEKQKELLGKLGEVLEMQVEKDKLLVADLQGKLSRLKHGGGQ
jgi:hypothetical protein